MRELVKELKKIQPNADVIRHKDVGHTSPTGCGKNIDMSRIIDELKKDTPKPQVKKLNVIPD